MSSPFPLEFDSHGLLSGPGGREAWSGLCASLEQQVDDRGWDQPACLFAVCNPVETELIAGPVEQTLHQIDPGMTGDMGGLQFAVVDLGDLDGYPVDVLWGHQAPPWAAALAIVFEGWTVIPKVDAAGNPVLDPLEHLPYSQHPDRVELRSVLMVTRDGAQYSMTRHRGQDPVVHDGELTMGGMLADVLLRMLDHPTAAPVTTVGDYLGRLALNAAARSVHAAVTGDLGEEAAANSALVEQARASAEELALLSAPDRSEVLTGIIVRTLAAAIAHLTWQATNHGEGPGALVPKPLRRALRDTAAGRDLSTETLGVTLTAARAAGGMRFNDLLGGKHSRALLPNPVAGTPVDWADEGLWSRRLCERDTPDQETLWALLGEHLEPVPAAARDLLHQIGWAPPAR